MVHSVHLSGLLPPSKPNFAAEFKLTLAVRAIAVVTAAFSIQFSYRGGYHDRQGVKTNMKFYVLEAFNLLLKTMPFILIRLGTYALLGLGLSFYLAIAGGIAWL